MAKRRRKFFVNVKESIELLKAFGFIVREMNFYQLRLKHQESQAMFDWYHTQGSVVITREGNCRRWKTDHSDAEELANDLLNNYIYRNEK